MFFDRWTIGRRLYVGCGALLALTILAGAVAVAGTARIKGDVDTVIVGGRVLMREGRVLQVDGSKILSDARLAFATILERAQLAAGGAPGLAGVRGRAHSRDIVF